MANWCNNILQFEGSPEGLQQLEMLFLQMAEIQKQENGEGQLPSIFEYDKGYLFEIRWEDDTLYYETKWTPNIELMVKIADHFHVGFIYSYEELGCGIYGEAQYSKGILVDVCLDNEDFALYNYNEDMEDFSFEGESYESDTEILEILLERKIAQQETRETELEKFCRERFQNLSNQELISRVNYLPDFKWDDEGVELQRRRRVSNDAFDYEVQGNKLVILKNIEVCK